MRNPYTPPAAQVGDIDVPQGSRLKAILAGLAVDLGGSILFGLAFIAIYGIVIANAGADDEQVAAALAALADDPWVDIGATAAGLLFSALGGYTCARIARHAEYRLAAILAAVSMTLGFMLGAGEDSLARNIAMTAAAFTATLAGAWLGASRNTRDQARRQRLARGGLAAQPSPRPDA